MDLEIEHFADMESIRLGHPTFKLMSFHWYHAGSDEVAVQFVTSV